MKSPYYRISDKIYGLHSKYCKHCHNSACCTSEDFCINCGRNLEIVKWYYCPECKRKISRGCHFCGYCGTEVGDFDNAIPLPEEPKKEEQSHIGIFVSLFIIAAFAFIYWISNICP